MKTYKLKVETMLGNETYQYQDKNKYNEMRELAETINCLLADDVDFEEDREDRNLFAMEG